MKNNNFINEKKLKEDFDIYTKALFDDFMYQLSEHNDEAEFDDDMVAFEISQEIADRINEEFDKNKINGDDVVYFINN